MFPVNPSPRVADAKVEDERHGFFRDLAGFDVTVCADCTTVHHEHGLVANLPTNESILAFARRVFKRVSLILYAIIPVLIQIGRCRDGLLVWTTSIAIVETKAVVWECCKVVVGIPVDVKWRYLVALRCNGQF
jgi:hypothetical protein